MSRRRGGALLNVLDTNLCPAALWEKLSLVPVMSAEVIGISVLCPLPRLQNGHHSLLTLRILAHAIYREFFKKKKMIISLENLRYFSYFCSKHRLWVHVRTASPRRFERVPTIYVLEQK